MRITGILFAVVVSAVFAGCNRDDAKTATKEGIDKGKEAKPLAAKRTDPESAHIAAEASASKPDERCEISSCEAVRAILKKSGISLGFDADRGRFVAIGTHGFSMKGGDKDEELESTETYDFPDDANDDFETKRFKAMWKAYADGLAEIATYMAMSSNHDKAGDAKSSSDTSESSAAQPLAGVKYLTMSESATVDGEYEVSVAVVQSKKTEMIYSRSSSGGEAKPGKYTIVEWLENSRELEMGMICPQSYCDNEGVWWRVAGVPVELDTGRNSTEVAVLTEMAKRYAYEAAMRTIAVGVSASTSVSSYHTRRGGKVEQIYKKFSRTVRIKPMNTVLPVDSSQVKWFEFDKVNVFTGKPVRCVVAALRSGSSRAR